MADSKANKKLPMSFLELLMIVIGIIFLIPILVVIFGSFKTQLEAGMYSLFFPTKWQFDNYFTVFKKINVVRTFLNNTIMTTASIVFIIIFSSAASFTIVRRNNSLMNLTFKVFISGLVASLMYIPTIRVFQAMHLMNTRTAAIILYIALSLPFAVFLFTGFIKSIPRELDEAAFVDGCSSLQTFFGIIVPLLKPVIFTEIIIAFMWIWNDIQIPMFFLNDSKKWTMPMFIYNFVSLYEREWNVVYAYLVLISVPVVMVFVAAQKYIVSGIMAGAVKG